MCHVVRAMKCGGGPTQPTYHHRTIRKIAQTARRELEVEKAVLPSLKVINRPVVTKLWISGRASEDRDEWTEEVRVHCGRCYDDKDETSEVQAEMIRRQRRSGDRCVSHQGASGDDHCG